MFVAAQLQTCYGHDAHSFRWEVDMLKKIRGEVMLTLYLEGQGDLVSRLITTVSHIVTPIIPIINPLTKSP